MANLTADIFHQSTMTGDNAKHTDDFHGDARAFPKKTKRKKKKNQTKENPLEKVTRHMDQKSLMLEMAKIKIAMNQQIKIKHVISYLRICYLKSNEMKWPKENFDSFKPRSDDPQTISSTQSLEASRKSRG